MSTLAIVAGLGLGLGLSVVAWQARLGLAMYLSHLERQTKPQQPAQPPSQQLLERLDGLEADVARMKMERLTGRR